ncbi:hypothetical protein BH23VER1_BH23VER1_27960 [soil metagenome]
MMQPRRKLGSAVILGVLGILGLVGSAAGQGAGADFVGPPETERALPDVRVERSIYLPYDDLRKVFEEDGRGVFLPYEEFQELWDQLKITKEKAATQPPTDSATRAATYSGEVRDGVAVIDATIEVESFKEDGWAVHPLGGDLGNIAEVEAGEAFLNREPDGQYQLLLPKAGRYPVSLTLYAPVERGAGTAKMTVRFPKTPVARFDLLVPGEGWDFEITPPTAFTSAPAGEATTKLSFFAGAGEEATIQWRKKGGESRLDPLVLVEADLGAEVVPGALRTTAELRYRILRAGVDSFAVAVPDGHAVLDVRGANINEWNVAPGADGGQTVTVALHEAAEDSYQLARVLELKLQELPATVAVPAIEAQGAARQSGQIRVSADPELDVAVEAEAGLTRQAGAGEAEEGTAPRRVATFRYLAAPFDVGLQVSPAVPEVAVKSRTRLAVNPDELSFRATFGLEIKRAGIFGARVTVPDGYEGIEANGAAVRDYALEAGADGAPRILEVKFAGEKEGTFEFEVSGRLFRDNPAGEVEVPVFAVDGSERHDASVGVVVDVGLSPTMAALGDLRQIDVLDLEGMGDATLAFRYRQGAEAPARIALEQKETQVFADVLELAHILEQVATFRWEIGYRIEYAGTDTFYIRVPEASAGDLRVENQDTKEVVKGVDAEEIPGTEAREGTVLWKIVTRDKHQGNYQIKLALDVPLQAPDAGQAFGVPVPEVEAVGVFRESGQVAVVKDLNLEILRPEPAKLEGIDPSELRGFLAGQGAFLAYKFRERPFDLTLQVSKNQYLSVPPVVVTFAAVDTVVSTDLATTSEAIFWLRNNAKQFLGVSLPEGARVVSDIFVNGEAQQPMRRGGDEDDGLLVRLPAGAGADAEVTVRFVYATPRQLAESDDDMGAGGSFAIPPVVLTDADVLESRLTLYLPQEYVYTEFDGAMRRPAEQRGWTRFRRGLQWLVPALGPEVVEDSSPGWNDPPPRPDTAGGGFDFDLSREGQAVTLHRLDRPAEVSVSYRSRTLSYALEAVAGLLALGIGLALTRKALPLKFGYAFVVGFGALVLGGVTGPGWASIWHMVFLGVLGAVIVWVVAGFWKLLVAGGQRWRERPRPAPATAAATPAPAPSPAAGRAENQPDPEA